MSRKEAIFWSDVESSGTSAENDNLLEIAAIITDMNGDVRGKPFSSLIRTPNISEIIDKADPVVKKMHQKSDLWLDLWRGDTKELYEVEENLGKWLNSIVSEDETLYFGGNSITLDRNFMQMNLPTVYEKISFRSIDVTTLSLSLQSNIHIPAYKKNGKHRALPDVLDSIGEYKHYLTHLENLKNS